MKLNKGGTMTSSYLAAKWILATPIPRKISLLLGFFSPNVPSKMLTANKIVYLVNPNT